jgi:hypothetical protein
MRSHLEMFCWEALMKHFIVVVALIASTAYVQLGIQSNNEVGILYFQDDSGFHAIPKVAAKVSGRTTISGAIPGSNSMIRLPAGQIPLFRICGVDPTRYKLYILKTNKDQRVLEISKSGGLLGGSITSVLSKSEIEIVIHGDGANCFLLSPRESLDRGEYGFSPVDSNDVFDFGIGSVKPTTK